MAITAYLDESGHSGLGHVVVAGFFENESQWAAFAPAWEQALKPRKSLHMRKLRWKHSQAQRLLAKLGPIPYKYDLRPVFGSVFVKDYYDLVENTLHRVRLGGYVSSFFSIIEALNRLCPGHETVRIVCEIQKQYESFLRNMFWNFTRILAHPTKPYFKSIDFVTKDETMLTQPADYLAFAIAKYLEDPKSKKTVWSRPIVHGQDIHGRLLTREQIRKVVRETLHTKLFSLPPPQSTQGSVDP